MSERQHRSLSPVRLSSGTPRALRRVRMLSADRWHAPLDARHTPTVIAVAAATPGLGTSVVVCNLAASIAGLGRRVVVVDLDFRAPRQHALFGVASPEGGIEAWLERKRARRDELAQMTSVRNLRLLPSTVSPAEPPPLDQRRALMQELNDLDSDAIIVDIGIDNRDDLFEFFAASASRLVVTSRESRALQATYAFLKGAALRAERNHGGDARAVLERFSGGLIGNAIEAPEEEESLHAFSRLVREHLGIPLPVVGCLRYSERIGQSVVARQPLMVRRGIDENVLVFHQMAELLMNDEDASSRACPLDGDPIPVAVAPLPADIARYARKHTRYPVDWAATLELSTGVTAVRVRDVSASGAGVETAMQLRIGDTGVLHLDQLPGHPAVTVKVKNLVPASNRIGMGFVDRSRIPSRLVAAARVATTRTSS